MNSLSSAEQMLFAGTQFKQSPTSWPEAPAVTWLFERPDIECVLLRLQLLEEYRGQYREFLEEVRCSTHDRTLNRQSFKIPFAGKLAFGFFCFLSSKVKGRPTDFFLLVFLVEPSEERKAFRYFDPLFRAYLEGAQITKVARVNTVSGPRNLPVVELN
jgi:hypothetical protein